MVVTLAGARTASALLVHVAGRQAVVTGRAHEPRRHGPRATPDHQSLVVVLGIQGRGGKLPGRIAPAHHPDEDRPARDKAAAGEPAAEATGRHHNVREDIGLIGLPSFATTKGRHRVQATHIYTGHSLTEA
jgi:hypothetical protein